MRLNSEWKALSARSTISAWRCAEIRPTMADTGLTFEDSNIPCRIWLLIARFTAEAGAE